MTAATIPQSLEFTAAPVYALAPNATREDISDQLAARLAQLSSMLTMIHGEGLTTFDRMGDTARGNYLWTCASLARECEELAAAR